ncbi:STAS domain-containing protein [Actinoplanes sp. KI2]|uniref:STAS domain-containing protein n=1 Tax=Actinoplanes sp. KI2 TaxID=2983315 RepID=UPI0021D56F71|nr:STAS domain-containing protein [Actinoplanes sp. KI2]MCU7730376.1 STAS domain-containing protein [Actinoplanes sp. KI2]
MDSSLSATWQVEGDRWTCALVGEIDMQSVLDLDKELKWFLRQPDFPAELSFDLKDVTFIDSASLTYLGAFYRRYAQALNGRAIPVVRLLNVRPFLLRVLVISGMDTLFHLEP